MRMEIPVSFLLDSIGLKNFPPQKLKYGSSRCFSPGSFAVFSGAALPPFRIFAGGLPRRRRRRNAFGLIQEYCTRKEFASLNGSPRFARRLIRIGFSGQKRIGDFAFWGRKFFNPKS